MNALTIYIIGAISSGFIFVMFTYIKSFYRFLNDEINEAKQTIKHDDQYSIEEQNLVEYINNDTVINALNILISIISWVGILLTFIYIFLWLIKLNN